MALNVRFLQWPSLRMLDGNLRTSVEAEVRCLSSSSFHVLAILNISTAFSAILNISAAISILWLFVL